MRINRDSMDEVRGYTIKMGNSSYKASELGSDRRLLASRLYRTWVMLHEQRVVPVTESHKPAPLKQDCKSPIIPVSLPEKKDEDYMEYSVMPKPKELLETAVPQSVKHAEQEMYHDSFSVGGRDYDLAIPMSAYQVMRDAVEVAGSAAQTANDVLRVAILLFLNYVDAATTIESSAASGLSYPSEALIGSNGPAGL